MGCYSQIDGDKIKFIAAYSDNGKQIRTAIEDDLAKGKEIAYMAAEEIKSKLILQGGKKWKYIIFKDIPLKKM